MKRIKRVLSIVSVAVLTMSMLVSCGTKDENSLAAAIKAAKDVNSMETEIKADIEAKTALFDSERKDYKASVTLAAVMFKSPMRMKLDMTYDMGGMSFKPQAFLTQENGKDMFYAGMQNLGWSKQEVSYGKQDTELKKYLEKIDASLFLSERYQYEKDKSFEENGKEYEVYKSKIKKEMVTGLIEKLGQEMGEEVTDADKKEIEEAWEDIPFTVVIDSSEKVLYRVEFNLVGICQKMVQMSEKAAKEEALKAAEETKKDVKKLKEEIKKLKTKKNKSKSDKENLKTYQSDVKYFESDEFKSMNEWSENNKTEVSKLSIICTYKNYNNATEFEVPKEALSAEEIKSDDNGEEMGSMLSLLFGSLFGGV